MYIKFSHVTGNTLTYIDESYPDCTLSSSLCAECFAEKSEKK